MKFIQMIKETYGLGGGKDAHAEEDPPDLERGSSGTGSRAGGDPTEEQAPCPEGEEAGRLAGIAAGEREKLRLGAADQARQPNERSMAVPINFIKNGRYVDTEAYGPPSEASQAAAAGELRKVKVSSGRAHLSRSAILLQG